LPGLSFFCDELGLKESEWMPESNAVYKLGIYHYDWLRPGSLWKHWFCYDRHSCDQQFLLETAQLPPAAARRYSYHIDAIAFGQMLKNRSVLPNGGKHISAHINQVQQHPDGSVSGLVLHNGSRITADFYIDCSGPARVLSSLVGIEFKPYGDIPNDRAIACPQPLEPLGAPNYTITRAGTAGWLWNTALTHRRGCGYTYSSAFITDAAALDEYLSYYPRTDQSKLRIIKFDSQYAVNPLEKNVLAVGLASGFIEPLEATSIYLIQYYIETFSRVINTDRDPRVFNKAALNLTRELYDFVLTNYTFTQRDDSEYWRYYRDLETRLDTRSMVIERANKPDIDQWSSSKMFWPYNWYSKAKHFELL
jgi:tryptophan halogenase